MSKINNSKQIVMRPKKLALLLAAGIGLAFLGNANARTIHEQIQYHLTTSPPVTSYYWIDFLSSKERSDRLFKRWNTVPTAPPGAVIADALILAAGITLVGATELSTVNASGKEFKELVDGIKNPTSIANFAVLGKDTVDQALALAASIPADNNNTANATDRRIIINTMTESLNTLKNIELSHGGASVIDDTNLEIQFDQLNSLVQRDNFGFEGTPIIKSAATRGMAIMLTLIARSGSHHTRYQRVTRLIEFLALARQSIETNRSVSSWRYQNGTTDYVRKAGPFFSYRMVVNKPWGMADEAYRSSWEETEYVWKNEVGQCERLTTDQAKQCEQKAVDEQKNFMHLSYMISMENKYQTSAVMNALQDALQYAWDYRRNLAERVIQLPKSSNAIQEYHPIRTSVGSYQANQTRTIVFHQGVPLHTIGIFKGFERGAPITSSLQCQLRVTDTGGYSQTVNCPKDVGNFGSTVFQGNVLGFNNTRISKLEIIPNQPLPDLTVYVYGANLAKLARVTHAREYNSQYVMDIDGRDRSDVDPGVRDKFARSNAYTKIITDGIHIEPGISVHARPDLFPHHPNQTHHLTGFGFHFAKPMNIDTVSVLGLPLASSNRIHLEMRFYDKNMNFLFKEQVNPITSPANLSVTSDSFSYTHEFNLKDKKSSKFGSVINRISYVYVLGKNGIYGSYTPTKFSPSEIRLYQARRYDR